jgi:hypothetical protein
MAGSDKGLTPARAELAAALRDAAGQLAAKIADRGRWGNRTRVSLPGDRCLQDAVDWGKQNVLDLTRYADDRQIRWLDQGRQHPPPEGTVGRARWVGAGFPDYPWMFATDGEYTAFASVAMGQFRADQGPPDRAARRLGDPQRRLGHRDPRGDLGGLELVRQGLQPDRPDHGRAQVRLQHRRDGQVPERASPDPGAGRVTTGSATSSTTSPGAGCAVVERLDEDGDGWPEGSGNVERGGMGVEKLDNSVYLIRGLYDLADLARSKHDGRTWAWARNLARRLHQRFEGTWWLPLPPPDGPQYADSIDDPPVGGPNNAQQDKHWIGVTPMEAELTIRNRAVPGLAAYERGSQALALRETDRYSGQRPYNLGLFHTGCGGGPDGQGERVIFGLNTAIQAVGEGNYGGLGAGQQKRYTDAKAEPMFGQPYTEGTPDEQPGSLPEILPSPDFDRAGARDATSTAAGRCGRCLSRPGATTARSGRWSTSSSACAPAWAAARSRWRPSWPPTRRSRGRTSASATGRSTSRPARAATATGPRSTPAAPRSCACGSDPRCRAGPACGRSSSTASATATESGSRTAAWRSR